MASVYGRRAEDEVPYTAWVNERARFLGRTAAAHKQWATPQASERPTAPTSVVAEGETYRSGFAWTQHAFPVPRAAMDAADEDGVGRADDARCA